MNCAFDIGTSAKFHKDWFRQSKVNMEVYIYTYTQDGDLMSLLLFFSK
jgi:hypothetical protein